MFFLHLHMSVHILIIDVYIMLNVYIYMVGVYTYILMFYVYHLILLKACLSMMMSGQLYHPI